jgi:NADH-ubiquinone oxidoreductase chain 5
VIIPLSILALFAIFLGFVASDFVGIGSDFFGPSIFYHPNQIHIIEAEFSIPVYVKLLPTLLSLLGGVLAFYLYSVNTGYHFMINLLLTKLPTLPFSTIVKNIKGGQINKRENENHYVNSYKSPSIYKTIYTFLNGKYLLDIIYNNYIISEGLKTGHLIFKLLDKGAIELIGPFGLTDRSYYTSALLTKLDTGVITTYALFITLGLISLLFLLFSPFPMG